MLAQVLGVTVDRYTDPRLRDFNPAARARRI